MPIQIKLPSRPEDYCRVLTGRDQKLRKQDYTYVPLLSQLEKLLQMEDVYKLVTKPKQHEAGAWMNYEDGTNYRNNDFFQCHPTALQLHLYIDEVQMCNAIGSYAHKIVFVYFSIANLPAKFCANIKCITLLDLFNYDQCGNLTLTFFLSLLLTTLRN